MPETDLRLLRHGDEPPWTDVLASRTLLELDDTTTWHVAVIDGGMTSGLPSVALRLDFDLGEEPVSLITQTSLHSLIAIVVAARGAFPDAFAGGPFEERAT